MTGPTQSTTVQDVRVVVTPGTSAPNVIPVGGRVPTQHVNILPYQQQQQQQVLHQHQQQQHHHGNDQHFAAILMALMVEFVDFCLGVMEVLPLIWYNTTLLIFFGFLFRFFG
jgi:hypothetical protein